MAAKPIRQRLIVPVALVGGGMLGLMTVAVFVLVPGDMLDRMILRSGIPAIIAAAEPPLGLTARAVLALVGGCAAALLGWFAFFLVLGSRALVLGGEPNGQADSGADDDVPVLRRADAHPDAPSRRPVFANRDLGTPFLDVRAPQASDHAPGRIDVSAPLPIVNAAIDLPDDLDIPLSAFGPDAIALAASSGVVPGSAWRQPLVAPAPVSAVARPQVFAASERFETFELTPMVRSEPVQPTEPRREPRDTQATITVLLERLERGVTQRNARPPVPSVKRDRRDDAKLQDTLGALRQMAIRG